MKKIITLLLVSFILFSACNKEADKTGSSNSSLQVSVSDVSGMMQVSATQFSSQDILSVRFLQTADSIAWWVTNPDSTGVVSDTAGIPRTDTTWIPPYIPPVDSSALPPDTTQLPPITVPPNIPIDTTIWFPGDTAVVVSPPIYDSSLIPHPVDHLPIPALPDSLTYQHAGSGFSCSTSKGNMKIGISTRGHYQVSAGAYHRNSNGSFTLIRTGYILLTAR